MVWGLELAEDRALVSSYVDLVEAAGGRVTFVELYAELEERLARNRTELRLAEKRSKRDLEFSRRQRARPRGQLRHEHRRGVHARPTDVLDGRDAPADRQHRPAARGRAAVTASALGLTA